MKKSQQGFTLIEVLVAMLIVAIAFTAILKVDNEAIAHQLALEQRVIAHWVGLQVINAVKVGTLSVPNTAQTLEQNTLALGQTWRWVLQLNNTPNEAIQQITVSVYLSDRTEKIVELRGYFSPHHGEQHA